ncbi:hypothetical protein GDO86_009925 [Hymenochirus boettgeri]|uniref:Glutamate-rich protein 1 n=1 Tax=Hymenochirus boettgeri TaxID=247094 RepID=A0A8T2JIE3_9PIPI|nr:hypothetical protein GDO86_009925 [Hymenochirus boettgeri]
MRLYPEVSGSPLLHPPSHPTEIAEEQNEIQAVSSTDGKKDQLKNQKIYTVSLPPDGNIPTAETEYKSFTSDTQDNEDLEEKTRNRRRRKKKKCFATLLNREIGRNTSETTDPKNELLQTSTNKNRRRKLQRRRLKEKMKDSRADINVINPTNGDLKANDSISYSTGKTTENGHEEHAKDLMEFLQATQEMYFTDDHSKRTGSDLSIDVILKILSHIEAGEFPLSDVVLLHHIKSLLLLQDIERLKDALDNFKQHSSLSAVPDFR